MIQLRIKTEYSFGQTFAPIPRIIDRLKQIGCKAAGIVDVGSTWGHVAWVKACKEAGIQPLLGVELCVSDDDSTLNMWFLATDKSSLSELYKWTSKSHRQPIATKQGSIPRLYRKDVLAMSAGIWKFSGDIVDKEFLLEARAVLDFNPSSMILNAKKKKLMREAKFRYVRTSDNAYCFPEDDNVFDLISKAGTKQTPQYILDEFQPVSPPDFSWEYVWELAISESSEALELPCAPMVRAEGSLEDICRAGIKFRKMESIWDEVYEKRLNYELDLIKMKDFESYFIIVSDMVQYAKKHMLVGPSRGSAAGSLVCYLARITEINPIPPKLYFERFIDATRMDLPDIDLDFPDVKRHLVFEYMSDKYGINNIAHIGTITQFKPKSALIQVCKALNIPPSATFAVKTAMIERSSADARASNCLQDTLETTEPGRTFIKNYPQAAAAALIEGHASHTGVHAAGLLVCNDEITNYATVDANGIAHIEKGAAETLGLLKIDVLGLRTLSVLEDSGVDVDWYNLPLEDQETFELFNSGNLCGIFQFEGEALRSISKQIKFSKISDVDAVTALARPGPFSGGVTQKYINRKNGEKYNAIHPAVEAQMEETYGLPVYQEQTLAIVREIGKFDWEETFKIRKAMSKRLGKEFFDAYWEKFKIGAASNGVEEKEARVTWELINTMGSWQMNKAHTFSYAVISYWCAYLKSHHPLEFAAANLRNAKDEESAFSLLKEIVKEGIEYVAFDIDRSELNWSSQDGKLYGGFLCLHGIGEAKANKIIEARKNGTITEKQRQAVLSAKNIFGDLTPVQNKFAEIYADPIKFGITTNLSFISDLEDVPHKDYRVFIAELVYKNPRNANEDANVKKRDGKLETGQLEYADFRFRDDTGTIGGRISRRDYLRIGKEIIENVPVGSYLLIKASFFNNIRYAFVSKWRLLND